MTAVTSCLSLPEACTYSNLNKKGCRNLTALIYYFLDLSSSARAFSISAFAFLISWRAASISRRASSIWPCLRLSGRGVIRLWHGWPLSSHARVRVRPFSFRHEQVLSPRELLSLLRRYQNLVRRCLYCFYGGFKEPGCSLQSPCRRISAAIPAAKQTCKYIFSSATIKVAD